MSEMLFLYCSHISFWPTFFKLPMGFCMGRGTITFIYEIEGGKTEVRECLCSYSFSLSSFHFEYGACFSTLCFISFTLLSIRFSYVLKHISVSLPLSLTADPQSWHASEV